MKNIRSAVLSDAKAIASIYNYYIEKTAITLQETRLDPEDIKNEINKSQKEMYPWIVYETQSNVLGFSYAQNFNIGCPCRRSAEISIYLHNSLTGKGIGPILMQALLEALATTSVHSILAGIALPNQASIKLVQSYGFTKVAHFEELGYKFGKWIDVGYWEKIYDPFKT